MTLSPSSYSPLIPKKATGLDNNNLYLLQDTSPAVGGPLSTIMNNSLWTGIIHEKMERN